MKSTIPTPTKHPVQPVQFDLAGTLRFKKNHIVEHLLDFARAHGCGLNELAMMDFEDDDRQQLAQLLGYSVDGYADLSYVDKAAMARVATQRREQMEVEG